jgi:putative PIN family toxin of toxin-antitoxin system
MKAVIDTNVIVSAMLNPAGNPAKVIDGLFENRFTAVVSADILEEYELVLKRPKFGFNHKHIGTFLDYLKNYSEYAGNTVKGDTFSLPHIDDLKFIEAGLLSGADFIVTGNLKHFPERKYKRCRVIPPQEFLALIG